MAQLTLLINGIKSYMTNTIRRINDTRKNPSVFILQFDSDIIIEMNGSHVDDLLSIETSDWTRNGTENIERFETA